MISPTLFIIIIAVAVAVFVLLIVIYPRDKCPYCGSKNLEITRMDATINYARWHARCKDCHKEFYIK